MSVIWKAVLAPTDVQYIRVPEGAELLTARDQLEQICVWFKCEPDKPLSPRRINMCGTGHDAPDGRYLGTGFLHGGQLVFHVFEQTSGQGT